MIGKVIVLLLLVAVLAAGGVIWFDYLALIDARTVLAPLYRAIGREGRTQPAVGPDEVLNLDAERLAVRLEAMELQRMELDTQLRGVDFDRLQLERMGQELDQRQNELDEMKNSLRAEREAAEDRNRNIEENARILTGMPPERAVGILSEMDDQDVIDVLRMTEAIAQAEGTASLVPFWVSLMDPTRAAELQRRMAGRPLRL